MKMLPYPELMTLKQLAYHWDVAEEELKALALDGTLKFHAVIVETADREPGTGAALANPLDQGVKTIPLSPTHIALMRQHGGYGMVDDKRVWWHTVVMKRKNREDAEKAYEIRTVPPISSLGAKALRAVDTTHPAYSRKLTAAVEAWHAMYVDDLINPAAGHVDQITAWLAREYADLTKEAWKQIAILVNAKKKGRPSKKQP